MRRHIRKHHRHVRKYRLDILNYIAFHTHRKRWLNERRAIYLLRK